MASGEVKLLGSWSSPFALRSRIAFNIKSVEYELQQEDVLVAKGDLLLNSNPVYKKIPVLIHDNHEPICESLVIVQYIDEVWASGPAILPTDPHARAIARFWTSYIDQTLFPVLCSNLLAEGEDAKRIREETVKGLVLLEDAFTKCSKGERFFGGDRIGYVDIALGCFLPWILLIDKGHDVSLIDESKTPNLSKWAQDFCGDAAVKGLLPDTDELHQIAMDFVSAVKGSATK